MERSTGSNMQIQGQRTQSTAIVKVQQEPSIKIEPTVGGQLLRKLFQIIFFVQLFLVSILVIVLTIRGLIYAGSTDRFHPKKWYPPLLVSTASAGIVSFIWQSITFHCPSKAIKTVFWFTPLLTCAVGVLHILIGSPLSLAAVYSSFSVTGIGGATATGTSLDIAFIVVILLSFLWSMQVIKNMLYVTISRIRYMNFACGVDINTRATFHDTVKHFVGSVCIGSAIVPVIGTIRGSARAINLVAGDNDEFLFSCADCYSGFASTLITYGNRWGFVHVGVYNKGFIQASADTWEMFKRVELISLIDSDLTGVFCFLSGVAVGSICGIVGGTWELIIHKGYATEVSIYAFLIGYFMCRIALAWQQASVSAYYVSYAENPQSLRFDATIPVRIEQLHRFQV
uniref:Choline transporter-like protein n=1 Tax=Gossypium raimondii TaxID=29730 RepID=A0A0D2SR24_GOSRA|nr:hypothetical protein B456_007G254200 [Gossypium raimondii]